MPNLSVPHTSIVATLLLNTDPDIGMLMVTVAVFTAAFAVIVLAVIVWTPPLVRELRAWARELFPPPPTKPHADDALRRSQLDFMQRLSERRQSRMH